MRLFKPAWMSQKTEKVLAIVREAIEQKDSDLLLTIALCEYNTKGSEIVVNELTDQALLARIAIDAQDSYIARAALNKVKKQTFLAKVAREARDDIRMAAFRQLTNPVLLADVAIETSVTNMIESAVMKLNDQILIAEVVKVSQNTDWKFRKHVFEKLTEQPILADLAMNAVGWKIRVTAVERLEDLDVLNKLVKEEVDKRVCITAEEKLNRLLKNTDFIENLVKKEIDSEICMANVIENNSNPNISGKEALEELLNRICKEEEEKWKRRLNMGDNSEFNMADAWGSVYGIYDEIKDSIRKTADRESKIDELLKSQDKLEEILSYIKKEEKKSTSVLQRAIKYVTYAILLKDFIEYIEGLVELINRFIDLLKENNLEECVTVLESRVNEEHARWRQDWEKYDPYAKPKTKEEQDLYDLRWEEIHSETNERIKNFTEESTSKNSSRIITTMHFY